MDNNFNIISNVDGNLLSSLEQFLDRCKQDASNYVPICIFANQSMGVLEALVKYLVENKDMSFSNISKLLNRDQRTIWTAYQKAIKKHKTRFVAEGDLMPISVFSSRKQAPLEAVVVHLRKSGMDFTKIAKLLNRSYGTVYLSYRNGVRHG